MLAADSDPASRSLFKVHLLEDNTFQPLGHDDGPYALRLSIADNRMTLSVNNPDSGSASEEIEVDYDSTPIEIGFNARYLLDITGQIEGKEVRFLLSDAGSPTIIEDTEDSRTLYVLMPMRV